MRYFKAAIILMIAGTMFAVFSVAGIIQGTMNYKLIFPSSITEFFNYYVGNNFKIIHDVVFLGLLFAIGSILFYFKIFIIYSFRNNLKSFNG